MQIKSLKIYAACHDFLAVEANIYMYPMRYVPCTLVRNKPQHQAVHLPWALPWAVPSPVTRSVSSQLPDPVARHVQLQLSVTRRHVWPEDTGNRAVPVAASGAAPDQTKGLASGDDDGGGGGGGGDGSRPPRRPSAALQRRRPHTAHAVSGAARPTRQIAAPSAATTAGRRVPAAPARPTTAIRRTATTAVAASADSAGQRHSPEDGDCGDSWRRRRRGDGDAATAEWATAGGAGQNTPPSAAGRH